MRRRSGASRWFAISTTMRRRRTRFTPPRSGRLADLMMLDYNLPRGNGSDILAAASHNPKLAAVPKVIVTSFLQAEELAQALELGASCLITKPVDFEAFMSDVGAKIAELLQTGRRPAASNS